MQCTNGFTVKVEDREVVVPCGRCRACRIRRSHEWCVRLYHESLYHDDSCFVTLTYDDEHLPRDGQIDKVHVQSFMKMLRSEVEEKLKYYFCGEYGEKTGRPHYHGILFGLGVAEGTYKRFSRAKWYPDTLLVEKGPLKASWRKGNIVIGTVTKNSIQYVTNYIQKRLYDEEAKKDGRVQPFSLMSKKLGAKYAEENEKELRSRQYVVMNGVSVGLPRYYAKILDMEGEIVKVEKENRATRSKDHKEYVRRSEQFDKVLKAKDNIYRSGKL